MEQEKILEGNKLIALFHGWQHKPTYKNAGKGIWDFVAWSKASWDAEAFQYHKSWDWLMPVIEKAVRHLPKSTKENNYIQSSIKIEAWMNSGYPYNFMTHCKIGDLIGESTFYISKGAGADAKDGLLIHSIWSAVIEFIKWYSQTVVNELKSINPQNKMNNGALPFSKEQQEVYDLLRKKYALSSEIATGIINDFKNYQPALPPLPSADQIETWATNYFKNTSLIDKNAKDVLKSGICMGINYYEGIQSGNAH